MAKINCNTTWLIIINCFSSLKGKTHTMADEVDGLNQKMAEALTTDGLLSIPEEEAIRAELESIEDGQLDLVERVIALQEKIQQKAQAFVAKKS